MRQKAASGPFLREKSMLSCRKAQGKELTQAVTGGELTELEMVLER
jgi:hypothetical protein